MRNVSKIESKIGQAKNGKMKVLYTRVSSIDQRTDLQRVNENDFDWVLEDKLSGSIEFFKRPCGAELKELVEKGLVESVSIWSISRTGRNLLDILQTLKYFTQKKIQVTFISLGLNSLDSEGKENPMSKMLISILGVIAEMQLTQIRENQRAGIDLAKARGVYKGRAQNTKETVVKFLSKPRNIKAIELLDKGYKGVEIMKILNMSPTTVCKIKKLGMKKQ